MSDVNPFTPPAAAVSRAEPSASSSGGVRLSFTWDDAYLTTARRRGGASPIRIFVIATLCFSVVLAGLLVVDHGREPRPRAADPTTAETGSGTRPWWLVPLVGVGVIVAISRAHRRARREDPYLGGEVGMEITDEHVSLTSPIDRTTIRWQAFSAASVHADGVVLRQGPHRFYWLPFVAIEGGAAPADLIDLVRRHLAKTA